MAERVIFWDIDGTLVKGSLERVFLRFLVKRGYVSALSLPFKLLRLSFPAPAWYRMKLVYLRGKSVDEVSGWIEQCWNEVLLDNLRGGALEVISKLRETGYRQVLLSGTLKPLAGPLIKHLGINEIIAAEPEIVDGVYTGRLLTMHAHGRRKVSHAEKWLGENNSNWKNVASLANHWNDRHLLARSAVCVAVHPDNKLRAYAERHNWPCVTEFAEIEKALGM